MEFIIGILAAVLLSVAVLYLDYIVFKREKSLLGLVREYKGIFIAEYNEHYETRKIMLEIDKERKAYKKAIDDCIENFNAVYSNTKLSFDEDKCAFVIEDIVSDDETPTEEEINAQNENNGD